MKIKLYTPVLKMKLYKDRRGKWRWRLVARNGKIPGQEGFSKKGNALRSAKRVRIAFRQGVMIER